MRSMFTSALLALAGISPRPVFRDLTAVGQVREGDEFWEFDVDCSWTADGGAVYAVAGSEQSFTALREQTRVKLHGAPLLEATVVVYTDDNVTFDETQGVNPAGYNDPDDVDNEDAHNGIAFRRGVFRARFRIVSDVAIASPPPPVRFPRVTVYVPTAAAGVAGGLNTGARTAIASVPVSFVPFGSPPVEGA